MFLVLKMLNLCSVWCRPVWKPSQKDVLFGLILQRSFWISGRMDGSFVSVELLLARLLTQGHSRHPAGSNSIGCLAWQVVDRRSEARTTFLHLPVSVHSTPACSCSCSRSPSLQSTRLLLSSLPLPSESDSGNPAATHQTGPGREEGPAAGHGMT